MSRGRYGLLARLCTALFSEAGQGLLQGLGQLGGGVWWLFSFVLAPLASAAFLAFQPLIALLVRAWQQPGGATPPRPAPQTLRNRCMAPVATVHPTHTRARCVWTLGGGADGAAAPAYLRVRVVRCIGTCPPACLTGAADGGAAAVASFLAAVVTGIYLCNACSGQEMLRRHGRGQLGGSVLRAVRSALALLLGGPRAALGALGSVCRGVAASLGHAAALLHPLTRLVSGLVVRFGGFVSGCVSASPSLSLSVSR
jgi:hypothetical protein